MKIGKEHLTPASREEITSTRSLWGTDIYTDDSDVIAACIHGGWIRGEWPEEVDIGLLGLDEGFYVSDAKDITGRLQPNGSDKTGGKAANISMLTEPPATGPMAVSENRDLHVTLLILPTLELYASTTRFGIRSREWGAPDPKGRRTTHDGLSFMITAMRWVTNSGVSQNRLRGKARRERIRKALREVELGPSWSGGARNESDARGNETPKGTEKGGDVTSWWPQSGKPPSEGDKENRPLGDNIAEPLKEQASKPAEATVAEAAEMTDKNETNGVETKTTETESMDKEGEKTVDGEQTVEAEKTVEEEKNVEEKAEADKAAGA